MHTENTSVTIITYMTQYTTARQYNMNEYMCFKFAYPLYCLYDMHSAFMTTVIYIYSSELAHDRSQSFVSLNLFSTLSILFWQLHDLIVALHYTLHAHIE